MITLGPDSICDVCLDSFDRNQRAPCSIECGHVFCNLCLDALSRANCPLCRSQIDRLTYVKLHVDWDNTEHPPSKEDKLIKPDHEEARTLMQAIQDMANTGSTEVQIQHLVQGLKAFLSSQPRDQFMELRVCHRMIKYIYEYKTQARSKQHVLKAELQLALDASSLAESSSEAYRAQCLSLQADLQRTQEELRRSNNSINELTQFMATFSMRHPLSSDAPDAPRNRDNIVRSSSPHFIISPLPELPLAELPEVYASRQHGSPSSSARDDDVENNSNVSSRVSSPRSPAEHHEAPQITLRPDSRQAGPSVLRRAVTPADARSYSSQASSPARSSPGEANALNRLNDLLSDSEQHDISPSGSSPALSLTRTDSASQDEDYSRSRAPSRLDSSPPAAAILSNSSRNRATEEGPLRAPSRYANLPPATSASAQALERMQRQQQNQAMERERSSTRQAQEEHRRSPSREPEAQPMAYRMSSTSSSSTRQPSSRSQRSPNHVSSSIEPTAGSAPSRSSNSYSSRSGSGAIRQSSASSRPASNYYSASSSVGRTRSGHGRSLHDTHVNA